MIKIALVKTGTPTGDNWYHNTKTLAEKPRKKNKNSKTIYKQIDANNYEKYNGSQENLIPNKFSLL